MATEGIKETKEVLIGVNELSIFLITLLKDGFQLQQDIAAIIAKLSTDDSFKQKLSEAYAGITSVGNEIKDITVAEGAELAIIQASYLPKIIEALKKA